MQRHVIAGSGGDALREKYEMTNERVGNEHGWGCKVLHVHLFHSITQK